MRRKLTKPQTKPASAILNDRLTKLPERQRTKSFSTKWLCPANMFPVSLISSPHIKGFAKGLKQHRQAEAQTQPFFPHVFFFKVIIAPKPAKKKQKQKTKKNAPSLNCHSQDFYSAFILFSWGSVTLGVPAATLWGSENTPKTCRDTLGSGFSGTTWGKVTDLHVTWRRAASYWFGTQFNFLLGVFFFVFFFLFLSSHSSRKR